jgi:hypothetical protein
MRLKNMLIITPMSRKNGDGPIFTLSVHPLYHRDEDLEKKAVFIPSGQIFFLPQSQIVAEEREDHSLSSKPEREEKKIILSPGGRG